MGSSDASPRRIHARQPYSRRIHLGDRVARPRLAGCTSTAPRPARPADPSEPSRPPASPPWPRLRWRPSRSASAKQLPLSPARSCSRDLHVAHCTRVPHSDLGYCGSWSQVMPPKRSEAAQQARRKREREEQEAELHQDTSHPLSHSVPSANRETSRSALPARLPVPYMMCHDVSIELQSLCTSSRVARVSLWHGSWQHDGTSNA